MVALALLGFTVATVGAGAHRSLGYAGVAIALLVVALVGVFAKVWQAWPGFIAYAVGWGVMTMIYASTGPGGSILIAADLHGYLWLYGGSGVVAMVAAIPRSVWVGHSVAP